MFEWNMPNYTAPTQSNLYKASGLGGNMGYMNPTNLTMMNAPVQPTQQHAATGQFENTLRQMATVQAPNYVNDFSNYYNDLMNKLSGMAGNQQGYTNAGLGQYGIGNVGQGQYNPGSAGLGMFDYNSTPLADYKINDTWNPYNSDVLNQLAGRISSNLQNPNASLAMGLARDQIQGQGLGARQQLTDSFAGLGGRGQGPAQAQMAQLNNTLNQQQSDAYRKIAMDTERNAITDAQALEAMRGGLYNDAQNRALQGQIAQGDIYKNLANIGLQSFEGARGGALANAGMSQSAFEDAMRRQLQGAELGANTFENARQRELQNAQMNNSIYSQNSNNNAQIAGYMAGLLPNMADFLKNQGNMDFAAKNQSFGNWSGLNAADKARKEQDAAYSNQYQQDYQKWLNDMMSWSQSRGATGRQF